MLFKSSAPGSLMLMGEYAVLNGGYALVAAVNHRMYVSLSPRLDKKITLTSALGFLETEVSQLQIQAPFQFVLTALKKYRDKLSSGCDIKITSEFSDQIGFASSAAVTVATLKVLHDWLQIDIPQKDFILEARSIVREVQGLGSGADVAACVLGGVVAYRAERFHAEKLNYSHPITVVYSGSKTKTIDAVKHVDQYFAAYSDLFGNLLQTIDTCAQAGIQAARENNHVELGKLMNIQQGLMESLTVSTPIIQEIISNLRQDTKILGAKISGSGLGDCVVALGSASVIPAKAVISTHEQGASLRSLDVKITLQGVTHE